MICRRDVIFANRGFSGRPADSQRSAVDCRRCGGTRFVTLETQNYRGCSLCARQEVRGEARAVMPFDLFLAARREVQDG